MSRKAPTEADYDAQNLQHARRVLADPEHWGLGQVEWARMVVERIEHGQIVPAA